MPFWDTVRFRSVPNVDSWIIEEVIGGDVHAGVQPGDEPPTHFSPNDASRSAYRNVARL